MNRKIQTSFKNEHKTSYIARFIAKDHNRGHAIENKIETVLNQLRETTNVKNLQKIETQHIQAYVDTLSDKVENKSLTRTTAATYITALNRIIEYINSHLEDRNLKTISASEYNLSRTQNERINRAVDENTHNKFMSYIERSNDIQSQALSYSVQLQREFGLRLRESIQIQTNTIQKALRTNILHLTKKDGVKSARPRQINIRNNTQKEILKNALQFMKDNRLKSLAPTNTIRQQYNYAERVRQDFNKSTDSSKMDYHGERYHYAQMRIQEGATKQEVSQELGHNRESITNIYLAK